MQHRLCSYPLALSLLAITVNTSSSWVLHVDEDIGVQVPQLRSNLRDNFRSYCTEAATWPISVMSTLLSPLCILLAVFPHLFSHLVLDP